MKSPTLVSSLTAALLCHLSSSIALADSADAFLNLLNTAQSHKAGMGITANEGDNSDDSSQPADQTAQEYFISDLDPVIQLNCVGCHQSGGTASNSGARLIFSSSAESNHVALRDFVTDGQRDSDWVLSKITGGSGHGGGIVISSGSTDYQSFERYFALLSGDAFADSGSQSDFWDGLYAEPREVTLRRASLLLAAKVASDESIARAKDSDEALRGEIIKLMRGEGFHDFLTSGANDRLLTDGLEVKGQGAIEFGYFNANDPAGDRYPYFQSFYKGLPEGTPEGFTGSRAYLTGDEFKWDFQWALRQEPLELIAHVVMTNQSYKQILTADYTMVNLVTNIPYDSGLDFKVEYPRLDGYYNRKDLATFKPGRNKGYITHVSDSEFLRWPHAGILSTPAWLNRYPSTATNRNRARARWTYYHFLGIDIEKSAPRTTDPVALTDTNNPTMNNPSCTVCHERLDPVAGAYQMLGDAGHYFNWGATDALPNAYKSPHLYGGSHDDQLYQNGDTWYRDMRMPGFEGQVAPSDSDSLQWLANQIVQDPRFATATVKFWWPAVFGADALTAPEDPEGPDYDQRLNAYNAQALLVSELATKFINSDYRLKHLLADMVTSDWYRSEMPESLLENGARDLELASIGRGRPLTPRELDNKNIAVFGTTWEWEKTGNTSNSELRGTEVNVYDLSALHRRTSKEQGYNIFYGGIDSGTLIKRNRELTPLMINVSKQMAVDLACQAVAYDFSLPQTERKMFTRVERDTFPGDLASRYLNLEGRVPTGDSWLEQEAVSLEAAHPGGVLRIQISDLTSSPFESPDGSKAFARLAITEVTLRKDEEETLHFSGYELPEQSGFDSAIWVEIDNGERNTWGQVLDAKWAPEPGGWMSLEVDLPEGNYELEVKFATRLSENNLNEAVRAHLAMTAGAAGSGNEATQAIEQQIAKLYLQATNTQLSNEQLKELTMVLTGYANREFEREHQRYNDLNWNSGENRCGEVRLFSLGGKIRENPSLEHARYNDPRAMVRAWTMLTHHIMSSFGYLHD